MKLRQGQPAPVRAGVIRPGGCMLIKEKNRRADFPVSDVMAYLSDALRRHQLCWQTLQMMPDVGGQAFARYLFAAGKLPQARENPTRRSAPQEDSAAAADNAERPGNVFKNLSLLAGECSTGSATL